MSRTSCRVESNEEESLRRTLTQRLQSLSKREPLEPTYKHLLINSSSGSVVPPRDALYKKIGAELRERVENGSLGLSGAKGSRREDLEDGAMRAAFTLRECKKHEQEALMEAYLGRVSAMEEARKRKVEGMALGLQEQVRKKKARSTPDKSCKDESPKDAKSKSSAASIAEKVRKKEEEIRRKVEETRRKQEARDRELEERERLKSIEKQRERERQREISRKREEERERAAAEKAKEDAIKKARMAETPQQALNRLYQPIFQALWDMEFANLHGTNPFRIAINADNCAAMGVPDYCDVVKQPMNLSYIQEKVNAKNYQTLQAFFADVELMISNALLYNSDPNNEFHIAAKEMKKKYKKMAKKVVLSLQQHQPNRNATK